jgi:hypothetical protein
MATMYPNPKSPLALENLTAALVEAQLYNNSLSSANLLDQRTLLLLTMYQEILTLRQVAVLFTSILLVALLTIGICLALYSLKSAAKAMIRYLRSKMGLSIETEERGKEGQVRI